MSRNSDFKLISGVIAGMLIGSATVVGANQAIQAIQNTEIKVDLNGQVQTFKDETTGEIQYPITYHDRTYLPLRNVAQLAGLSVDYNNNSKTAILTGEESIDFQYLENYYNDNNGRIMILGDGYTDLEKFDKKYKYYLDKTGSLLTIDASSYEMPDNKNMYNLTGFVGNVKSCLAIYRKLEMGNLQDVLIVALNDSGRVFVLAPSSNSFVSLNFSLESYGERFIEKIGIPHKTISEYIFASETYDNIMLINTDLPSIYLKDEYGNLILLNTSRNNEMEFLSKDNELRIVVENNYEPLYFSIVNNVKPATKFDIRNIEFNNEEVINDEIQKIEYWFDNEAPKEISREASIPEVYLNSPYNTLNIKIKYNNKDYQFSYKINPKSFETAGFVEDCIKYGDYYKCKINGVEYTGISREVNNNSFVFLAEMDHNKYIPIGITEVSDVDIGRKVTKITEDSIELTDTRGKATMYKNDELYARCSIMNYFEVDNNNNFVKNQMAFSRNHPSFTLQVGDTITSETAYLGLLNIIRKVEKASEHPFFTYNDNAEILVSYIPDILYEDSEINFNLTNYLKDNEKLIIKCTCDGKTVDIYNNHYEQKKYVLQANQISKAFNKSYSDLNGNEAKIEALICDNNGKVVNDYSFSTYIGKKEPIEITTNFGSIKDDDSKITISFNREIEEYEELEVNFLLKTSNDGGARSINPKLIKLSNGNIEIDLTEFKQKTFDILNNKGIFNLVNEGNEVKAYNILDPASKDYAINLNEVEISLEVQVMHWQKSGMGAKGGNYMGRINLVNKFSLMDFIK